MRVLRDIESLGDEAHLRKRTYRRGKESFP